MLTEVSSKLVPPSLPDIERVRLLVDFINNAAAAEAKLTSWRHFLQALLAYPNARVNDSEFMSRLREMSEVGLDAWLDGFELDGLRCVLTGKECDHV